jgi:hypothetical protein
MPYGANHRQLQQSHPDARTEALWVSIQQVSRPAVVFGLFGSLLNPHCFTGTVTMFVLLQAFAAAGHKWTPELCKADSDGDGFTNGQELGDLDCTVRLSLLGLPTRGGGGSHRAEPHQRKEVPSARTQNSIGNGESWRRQHAIRDYRVQGCASQGVERRGWAIRRGRGVPVAPYWQLGLGTRTPWHLRWHPHVITQCWNIGHCDHQLSVLPNISAPIVSVRSSGLASDVHIFEILFHCKLLGVGV